MAQLCGYKHAGGGPQIGSVERPQLDDGIGKRCLNTHTYEEFDTLTHTAHRSQSQYPQICRIAPRAAERLLFQNNVEAHPPDMRSLLI